MKNSILLALANIRKNKGQTFNLLAVVFIAGFLLNLGLLLLFNFSRFYEERSEKLHTPHAAIVEDTASYRQEQADYLKNYPGVTETESQEVLAEKADIKFNGDKIPGIFIMVKASSQHKMNPLKLLGKYTPLDEHSIYLPYIMKAGGKLTLGGDFYVSIQGREYHYTIAGFTEEAYFGSSTIQMYRFYLSDEAYESLKESQPSSQCVLQTVRMENPLLSDRLVKDFSQKFHYEKAAVPGAFYTDSTFSTVKTSRTFLSGITSMIFVALSAIILLVSLVVTRFRIHNSLEEGMVNIGILKAMGYLDSQIIASLILQFSGISAVGVLLGIGFSYPMLPFLSDILKAQTALVWNQGFDPFVSGIAFLSISLAVFATTALTSLKIRKMQPLTALRGGIATHNFRKNPFPLETSRAGLPLLLALKTMFRNKKQMLMVTLVIACVTFAAASGLSTYYNVGLHPDDFATLVAGEVPDAVFVLKDPKDSKLVLSHILQLPDADRAIYYSTRTVLVEGEPTMDIITDDFSLTTGKMLYKGRYPKHDNEIALCGKTAALSGKAMGDTIEVTYNGKTEEYLITGLIQTMNDNGKGLAMITEGMKRLFPDFVSDQIYVYMKDPGNTASLIEEITDRDGELFSNTLDMSKLVKVQLGGYGSIFAVISTAITLITFLVVVLVLYLVLKTAILRYKRELGIQKALGYTTFQLMNQIALSFSPAIIAGTVIGCLMGIFGFNSLFVALVSSMGIMTANLPPSILLTLLLGIGIVVFSYGISMLIAFRIRNISPYTLVSE